MAKNTRHSELVSETNKGGESLPLARTSSLATPSSGGHPRNAPVDTPIEAPYVLPEGWKWIPLLESFENKTSSNKKLPTKDYSNSGKFAVVDQGQEFIGGYSDKSDFVFDSELPIIVFGDHTKCIKYIDFPFIQGADGVKILKPISIVDSKFFYYALQNIHFPDLGYRRHFPIFKDYLFPLPPTLAEQQRIVNRIETMFAKLDQAQEKAQSVLDSFETRKAAILHKAFTGELTANWRKENGVSDDSWEEKTVGDCCTSLKYGTAKKSESSGKVAVIRMGNLQHGEIEYDDLVFSNDEEDIKKYSLSKGDVLFNRTNSPEWVGKTSIYRGDIPAIYAGYLIKLDYIKTMLIGDYLNYMLNSPNAKEYCNSVKTDGVNQSNINAQKIGAYEIPVPSLPEQQKIVRILDTVLEKETRAKEAAQTVLDQIALLKKSILARAFRGEL